MARGKYPLEIKKSMVARFLSSPEAQISSFAKENGIPESCLRDWIRESETGILGTMNRKKHFKYWSLAEKYEAITEFDKLVEKEQGLWLRKHGMKSDRIELWRKEILEGLSQLSKKTKASEPQEVKALKKELRMKEKALAEASAVIFAKKKLDVFFGEKKEDN